MEGLLGLDDSAWQEQTVCVGVEGGVLKAIISSGGLCVWEGLQSLTDSLFPLQLSPLAGFRPTAELIWGLWWSLFGGTTERQPHPGGPCGSTHVVWRPGEARRERPAFGLQRVPGWVRGGFCHHKQGMLFSPGERSWNTGESLGQDTHTHMQPHTHKQMRITRIRMISSGFLSSTGIPLTSFSSSPTWISPATHKHTVYISTINLIFHYSNISRLLCGSPALTEPGGCVRYTKLMFIVVVAFEIGKGSKRDCWHVWKCAFSLIVAELRNRLDTMNTKSNRKHVDSMQSFAGIYNKTSGKRQLMEQNWWIQVE